MDKDDGTVFFYVDQEQPHGLEKSYKASAVITLERAGTKKGKTVTYTVPIMIMLKK